MASKLIMKVYYIPNPHQVKISIETTPFFENLNAIDYGDSIMHLRELIELLEDKRDKKYRKFAAQAKGYV